MFQVCVGFLVLSLLRTSTAFYQEGPVIGILAQEVLPSYQEVYPNYTSYIAASYVKAVEAAGARAVPIQIGQSLEYYKKQLMLVNGVLLPGGAANLFARKGYGEAGKYIYKLAIQANINGDYFPIFGVCLGFELLLQLANDNKELRTHCDSERVGLPLTFLPTYRKSKLFGHADRKVIEILKTQPVTSNHHTYCITPRNMTKTNLNKEWNTLSVNQDSDGLTFVSSVESIAYPFVGVQFHPEKSIYEWNASQNNPHSHAAVIVARHFYDWLAVEASKNRHTYPSEQRKMRALIANFPVFFSGSKNLYFEQVYLFK